MKKKKYTQYIYIYMGYLLPTPVETKRSQAPEDHVVHVAPLMEDGRDKWARDRDLPFCP